eukprot:GFUD01031252.1.p1 GENE.GFUD01031252.1~~GFUD01031252.1.p1  ORF type:complete len:1463 (+),score=442.15 GFUD01031252.1:69-4457(+)
MANQGRFYFSLPQKERLHKEFRKNINPSKEFREDLATELLVPVKKIDMWYGARRQKAKIAQEKKLGTSPVGKVSINPINTSVTSPSATRTRYSQPVNIPSAPVTVRSAPQTYPSESVTSHGLYPEPVNKLTPPVVINTVAPVIAASDFNSNLEKEKAALEKLDVKDIARHFLNLGKTFNELKNLFDLTEAKIKTKVSEGEPVYTNHSNSVAPQDDSREKLLDQSEVKDLEIWIDNDPSVPRGWSTKLGKNGINKGPRKIFRDPSGRIFYSRKQALNDMILKNIYSNEEIRYMESFCKSSPVETTNDQETEPASFNQFSKPPENRNNFSKTIGEQVIDNNTEWNENDPDIPRGWKSKDVNGMTMVKGTPPSNDMYLSRIAAYKALLANPSGHGEEIEVFRKYFEAIGTDVVAALGTVESEWKTDINIPSGWKYTHTIREAPNRKSGYKRLLSFLTEKGSKLNSSLIALEYMGDAGYSNSDKERLKSFINSTKLNEKRRAEQLKISSTFPNFCPVQNTPPVQSSAEQLFQDFYPAAPIDGSFEKQPVSQRPEPSKVDETKPTEIKTEPLDSVPEPCENVEAAIFRAEDMIKIEVEETDTEETNLDNNEFHGGMVNSSDLTENESSLPHQFSDEKSLPAEVGKNENTYQFSEERSLPTQLRQYDENNSSSQHPMERSLSAELEHENEASSQHLEKISLPAEIVQDKENETSSQQPKEIKEDNEVKISEDKGRSEKHEKPMHNSTRKSSPLGQGNEKSLQFGFYNDESFIKKVASETNSTIYKTALYEDTSYEEYDTAEFDESSLLIQEDEESDIPSHLSEHNYTFPHDRAPQDAMYNLVQDRALQDVMSQSENKTKTVLETNHEEIKEEASSFLNETSLFYEADQLDESSFYEESPVKVSFDLMESIQDVAKLSETDLLESGQDVAKLSGTEVQQTQQIEQEQIEHAQEPNYPSQHPEMDDTAQQLSSTPVKPSKIMSPPLEISLQKIDSTDNSKVLLTVQFEEENNEMEDLHVQQNHEEENHEEKQEEGWTNCALDDTKFESDEEELDAIQNMIKNENDETLDENQVMDESIKEEEEINDFIQKEFALREKETTELESASKGLESAVKDLNDKHEDLKKLIGSTSTSDLLEEDVDNFLINDLLKSDEDDQEKLLSDEPEKALTGDDDPEKSSDEKMRAGMRYEPDPFLPVGWKQATYFVKKSGIEIHRYMSPDGQKFTSRKLMINFMKNKGYDQNDLDRVMEGTKCKRKAVVKNNSSAEESLEEPAPEEPKIRKVIKERFITSLNNINNGKEDNKRKRPVSEDKKDDETVDANNSLNYNADISENVEACWNDIGDKKRRRGRPRKDEEDEIRIKKEPNTDSILEPVSNETTAQKEDDESSIGPKMSISRSAFKLLSLLFLKSPIPSNSELASISKSTDVSSKDVKWWFIKIRHKVKINKVEKDQVKNYLDSLRICHYRNGTISL